MRIAVARQSQDGETRVAPVTELVAALVGLGHGVALEPGAGRRALAADEHYLVAGAQVHEAALDGAGVVVSVQALPTEVVRRLRSGTATVSFVPVTDLADLADLALVAELRDGHVSCFATELVPRTSRARSMDALSARALVAFRALCPAPLRSAAAAAAALRAPVGDQTTTVNVCHLPLVTKRRTVTVESPRGPARPSPVGGDAQPATP